MEIENLKSGLIFTIVEWKLKIEFYTWQIELNVVYTYTETEIEKGESTMKNAIRYMIAGIGFSVT